MTDPAMSNDLEREIEQVAWETLQTTLPAMANSVRIFVKVDGLDPKTVEDLVEQHFGAPPHVCDMVFMAAHWLAREIANADA